MRCTIGVFVVDEIIEFQGALVESQIGDLALDDGNNFVPIGKGASMVILRVVVSRANELGAASG
jgi:hypothetical protein